MQLLRGLKLTSVFLIYFENLILNLIITNLITHFFYLPYPISYIVALLLCHIHSRMKNNTEFKRYKLYLICLPTARLLLVMFTHILGDFYHLFIALLLSTHLLIDVSWYYQVGLKTPENITLDVALPFLGSYPHKLSWKGHKKKKFLISINFK